MSTLIQISTRIKADKFEILYFLQELRKISEEDDMKIFENGLKTSHKQECHTLIATKSVEKELQETLVGLAQSLFGPGYLFDDRKII